MYFSVKVAKHTGVPMNQTMESESTTTKEDILVLKILNIHLIVNKIFKHLSFNDLLTCSSLSKEWYSKTRQFMLKNKTCVVRNYGLYPCLSLKYFNDFLMCSDPSAILPFNGYKPIHSEIALPSCCENIQATKLHRNFAACQQLFPALFSKLQLKYFKISSCSIETCPVYKQCIEALLKKNFDTLIEIEVATFASSVMHYERLGVSNFLIRSSENGNTFTLPNLKSIVFCHETFSETRLKQLLDFAPNLKFIEGWLESNIFCEESLLIRRQVVIRSVSSHFNDLDDTAVQLWARHKVEFKFLPLNGRRVKVEPDADGIPAMMSFDPCITEMLNNSSRTLQEIECAMEQLMCLCQSFRLRPLESVSKIEIETAHEKCTQNLIEFLPLFDLSSTFPNLKQIKLSPFASFDECLSPDYFNYQTSRITPQCPTVTTLWINLNDDEPNPFIELDWSFLGRLVHMFPNVTRFVTYAALLPSLPFLLGNQKFWDLETLSFACLREQHTESSGCHLWNYGLWWDLRRILPEVSHVKTEVYFRLDDEWLDTHMESPIAQHYYGHGRRPTDVYHSLYFK